MNFQQAIASGFRNYVTFAGRASRSEYWFWTLFAILVGAAGFGVWQGSTEQVVRSGVGFGGRRPLCRR